MVVGCWLLVVGCWLLVVGCWLLVVVCCLLFVVKCFLCITSKLHKIFALVIFALVILKMVPKGVDLVVRSISSNLSKNIKFVVAILIFGSANFLSDIKSGVDTYWHYR